ncbi:MAG: hypothetical protein KJ890_07105 [Gammaproteobacteria bacterium]|nr:hypothetical protein [Gammaproteobacteria bacterium]MBU1805218.1 hypothetical protein [Gammaproteobacteria bacterium]
MSQEMDRFRGAAIELSTQVDALIARVKALANVGPTFSVEDARVAAEAAAVRAEAAAESIAETELTAATNASAAEQSAAAADAAAAGVQDLHEQLLAFRASLDEKMATLDGAVSAARLASSDGLRTLERALAAQSSAEIASAAAQSSASEIQSTAQLLLDAKADLQDIRTKVTAAINAAEQISTMMSEFNAVAYSARLKFKEVAGGAGVAALDFVEASIFRVRLADPLTTLSLSGLPAVSDRAVQLTIILHQATGSNSVKWPTNIRWSNGIPPVLSFTKGREDVVTLIKCGIDDLIYGFFSGDDFIA